MRAAANFKGHAIHAALIPFPFAFLLGAAAFDGAGRVLDVPALWTTGGHLAIAGVGAALVAAVFGAIDYFRSVPPRSTGKRRATKHALANLSATLLFAIVWLVRDGAPPGAFMLGLEGVGAVLLVIGGWMGGTLVSRNQIGVDHRYARAGKWKQERLAARDGAPIAVARSDELEPDQMKLVEIDGRRIVVARNEDGWSAFDDGCTHRGGSLADGVLICGTVQCPWHGSQFDVRNGKVKAGPAEEAIRAYAVEEVDGEIRLRL